MFRTDLEPDRAPEPKVCETCGQAFDPGDLDQVFHHDANPHAPLEDEAAA